MPSFFNLGSGDPSDGENDLAGRDGVMEANRMESILTLQATIDAVLAPLMPRNGRLALLDFPDHGNVGDSAIWLGVIRYLRTRHGIAPRYVCTASNFCAETLGRAVPNGPILLHGGGNFGDIWPVHQRFREMVLEKYPNRPIVQLPQSIHFDDPGNLERAARVINGHPNFTLLVRDRRSFDLATAAFTCPVVLCPDMAFCLGSQRRHGRPELDVLLLLRGDKEARTLRMPTEELPARAMIADWVDDEPGMAKRVAGEFRRKRYPLLRLRAWDGIAQYELRRRIEAGHRLRRGLRQLASARYVITDRLHAHILCVLLGIPHTTLDNSYGKIRQFEETWTKGLGPSRQAENLAEALNGIRDEARAGQY